MKKSLFAFALAVLAAAGAAQGQGNASFSLGIVAQPIKTQRTGRDYGYGLYSFADTQSRTIELSVRNMGHQPQQAATIRCIFSAKDNGSGRKRIFYDVKSQDATFGPSQEQKISFTAEPLKSTAEGHFNGAELGGFRNEGIIAQVMVGEKPVATIASSSALEDLAKNLPEMQKLLTAQAGPAGKSGAGPGAGAGLKSLGGTPPNWLVKGTVVSVFADGVVLMVAVSNVGTGLTYENIWIDGVPVAQRAGLSVNQPAEFMATESGVRQYQSKLGSLNTARKFTVLP